MPLYSTSGSLPVPVYPGQQFTLFSGTETPSAGLKSVAFERAANWSGNPSPMTFTVTFPNAPTAAVLIQGSNDDVEAHYQTLNGAGVTAQTGYYGDLGQFRFYRAVLNSYSAGLMPTVICQR